MITLRHLTALAEEAAVHTAMPPCCQAPREFFCSARGRFCDGFRMPANATCQRAPGPASESRQGTKPRGVGHPVDQRALWGIGWHRCRSMGPKMLHRHDEAKTGAGPDSARSLI